MTACIVFPARQNVSSIVSIDAAENNPHHSILANCRSIIYNNLDKEFYKARQTCQILNSPSNTTEPVI